MNGHLESSQSRIYECLLFADFIEVQFMSSSFEFINSVPEAFYLFKFNLQYSDNSAKDPLVFTLKKSYTDFKAFHSVLSKAFKTLDELKNQELPFFPSEKNEFGSKPSEEVIQKRLLEYLTEIVENTKILSLVNTKLFISEGKVEMRSNDEVRDQQLEMSNMNDEQFFQKQMSLNIKKKNTLFENAENDESDLEDLPDDD